MFCCTRKESHKGQIVNAICLESQCAQSNTQLCCVSCLKQEHHSHQTTTMKKILPELLEVHREKTQFESQLTNLTNFVCEQFGTESKEGKTTTKDNIVQRVRQLLQDLKQQVDLNNEEMSKMKSIFKNLNKNTQQNLGRTPSRLYVQEERSVHDSPNKSNPSTLLMKTNASGLAKAKGGVQNNSNVSLSADTFSHTAKHPYLNVSQDLKTVVKASHSGHRFAAVGGRCLNENQHQIRMRVDKSVSGNIMIGFCHESLVREKEYSNCYGIGNGTYLIGQNGNNPITAISFHNSLSVMNRKEVVGFNFTEGDEIVIGINYADSFIYFRKEGGRQSQEFSMKLGLQTKPQLKKLYEEGFKLIVLLQSEGDQVTLLDHY